MAKKLLGDRIVGDKTFTLGQVITDDEAAAMGFDAGDVADVSDNAAPVQQGAPAKADEHAELDSAEKKEGEQSSSSGASGEQASADAHGGQSTGSEGGASSSEAAPQKRTLTEQDLVDNPELAAKGFKVGDEVDAVVQQ